MGFGMIGVAAMQSALRSNTDIARQRSEAVRIAEEAIERARAYSVVNSAAGRAAFADVASVGPSTVDGYTTNTTYTRTITVTDSAAQAFKTLVVDVDWADRANTSQRVRMATVVHRTPPELAAALSISGNRTAVQMPGGRHAAVPRSAVDQGDGTSVFTPPGGGSTTWIFENATGFVTQICILGSCTPVGGGRLLHGFIAFATAAAGPSPALAESPPGPALLSVGVTLNQTEPASPPAPPLCVWGPFPDPPATAVAIEYFCLIRTLSPLFQWSGQTQLSGLTLAASVADPSASAFRVCRYTPYRNNDAVGSGSPPIKNSDHPFTYAAVSGALLNQNFLVIRAGDGSTAFDCPADDPATPLINGSTFHHQPAP